MAPANSARAMTSRSAVTRGRPSRAATQRAHISPATLAQIFDGRPLGFRGAELLDETTDALLMLGCVDDLREVRFGMRERGFSHVTI